MIRSPYFKFIIFILSLNTLTMCVKKKNFDVQGHRGCRGLYPENTLPAFSKALELGVTTLELDMALNKDNELVVSHEPFFSHEITTFKDGSHPTKENEKSFNLNHMTQQEISRVDVGSKDHPRFPEQKKMEVTKPLLQSVIDLAENYALDKNKPLSFYNIEIKSKPEWDSIFYPSLETFVDKTAEIIFTNKIVNRTYVQSFDVRALEICKAKFPDLMLVYLVENRDDIVTNLEKLSFTPEVYSPAYPLIDDFVIETCKEKNMLLIPWTVNEVEDMKQLIHKGVDGIITDYPDRLLPLIKQ